MDESEENPASFYCLVEKLALVSLLRKPSTSNSATGSCHSSPSNPSSALFISFSSA